MLLAVDIGNTTIGFCGIQSGAPLDYEITFCFKMDNDRSMGKEAYAQKIYEKLKICCAAPNSSRKSGACSSAAEAYDSICSAEEATGSTCSAEKVPDITCAEVHALGSTNSVLNSLGITGIAISSVVPSVTDVISEALKKIFAIEPLGIRADLPLGLTFAVDEPEKVGIDRLCDAAYAAAVTEGAVITVDMGTSTTINVIDAKKRFLGGSIMPGLETGFHALTEKAAQLYDTRLSTPSHFIGKNTRECMEIGVVAGMAGSVDALLRRMEQELGVPAEVILTGGCAKLVSPLLQHAHRLDEDLLYKGIAYLYERYDSKIGCF